MFGNASVYVGALTPNAGAGTLIGANNGLSLDATGKIVQLGQNVGAVGNPGALLSNREIPMAGFSLLIDQIGQTAAGNLIFKASLAKPLTTPFFLFEDSTGLEIGRINFTANSTYIGTLSGSNDTSGSGVNVGVGALASQSVTSGARNTAVGFAALQLATGGFNTAVGQEAGSDITTGTGNNCFGRNAGLGITTGTNNTLIGNEINTLGGAASSNVCVGAGTGGTGGLTVVANGCVFVGFEVLGTVPTYGNNNTLVGFNIFNTSGNVITTGNIALGAAITMTAASIGANNILIGQGINMPPPVSAAVSNTTLLGSLMSSTISNICGIGRADQNVIMGITAITVDLGVKLQVAGAIVTAGAPPLTLGAGTWDFGRVKAAASVLNAASYLELSVNGALVKICIN
jgi:hypothetical protein